jgi:hypothetical protein
MKPRLELAFWSTFGRMAEKASYEAPAQQGTWQACRTVVDHAAAKTEHWRVISEAAQGRQDQQKLAK